MYMEPEETYSFRGRTIAEAQQKVMQKLGANAFVLGLQHHESKSLLGGTLGGNDEIVEIIAAPGDAFEPKDVSVKKPNLLQKIYQNTPAPIEMAEATPEPRTERPARQQSSSPATGLAAQLQEMEERICGGMADEIKKLKSLLACGNLPAVNDTLLSAYHDFVENEVPSEIARPLVEHVQSKLTIAEAASPERVQRKLFDTVALTIGIAPPAQPMPQDEPRVIALVGAAGVGKTTAITKLAVDFVLNQRLQVAIIYEDRRPVAEAQYRSLSQLLGLPVLAADTPAALATEIALLHDYEVILVDTLGRSPSQTKPLTELGVYLESIPTATTHLVLPLGSSAKTMTLMIEKFRPVGFEQVILSKIDETASFGQILTLAVQAKISISYLTQGQDIRKSALLAKSTVLARLVVGKKNLPPAASTSPERRATLPRGEQGDAGADAEASDSTLISERLALP